MFSNKSRFRASVACILMGAGLIAGTLGAKAAHAGSWQVNMSDSINDTTNGVVTSTGHVYWENPGATSCDFEDTVTITLTWVPDNASDVPTPGTYYVPVSVTGSFLDENEPNDSALLEFRDEGGIAGEPFFDPTFTASNINGDTMSYASGSASSDATNAVVKVTVYSVDGAYSISGTGTLSMKATASMVTEYGDPVVRMQCSTGSVGYISP